MASESSYIIKPVHKALQVLRHLGEAGRGLTLSEVSQATGLPKSTAFKYLRTLTDAGFTSHDPSTDSYRVGLLVWQIGQLSTDHTRLREIAAPHMRDLAELFDETVRVMRKSL